MPNCEVDKIFQLFSFWLHVRRETGEGGDQRQGWEEDQDGGEGGDGGDGEDGGEGDGAWWW